MAGHPIGSTELREQIREKVEAMRTPEQRAVERRYGVFMPPGLARAILEDLNGPVFGRPYRLTDG